MSKLNFPVQSNKVAGVDQDFNISDPGQRQTYFRLKAGPEIEKIKTYLENRTFVAIMLGKKGSGKGTYSGMLKEIFGDDHIGQISVGDITRAVFEEIKNPQGMADLKKYLENNYRGYISIDEAIDIFVNKTQGKLLPTEFILSLVTREIEKLPRKALIIDGFPRNVDQVSYSLYLRSIINFRDDPDFMVLIDIPETVIDARIKNRFICPKCQTSRNLTLLPSSKIGFDETSKEYYLICDKAGCDGGRMVRKEGDEQGIAPIKDRLDLDGSLMEMAQDIHGIQKIFLRNPIPLEKVDENFDTYEMTPEFYYEKSESGEIATKTKPWVVKDDNGIDCVSLMAPAVMVSYLRQLAKILPNI
ncbi:MAG: nucleoside monophosphate kinase [Microgenomates group bacterium]